MDGKMNKTMSNDPEVAKHVNSMFDMLRKNQILEARLKEIYNEASEESLTEAVLNDDIEHLKVFVRNIKDIIFRPPNVF